MKERIISAVVAFLIVVPFLLLGGIYFDILVVILGILGLKELLNFRNNIPSMMKYISYVLLIILILYGYIFTGKVYIMNFSLIIICFMTLFLSLIFYNDNKKYNILDAFYLLSSIIFLSSAFNLFIVVRSKGLMLTLYLLLITIITDTFAYLIGSKIGHHKLIPRISPNKSIEGSIGGLIVGTIVPSIFYYFCISSGNIGVTILITMVLSIIVQCGDLVFSQIKRNFNVKDFSNIMPGHGGILDRLDSIIFVLFGYIIISIIL